jgi:hypothetical protein
MENWKQRWYIIRLVTLLISCPVFLKAQKRHFLVPDAVLIQHAGSIGYFSTGLGYDLFKNKKANLDLLYGYVPEARGGRLDIVTAKVAYRPMAIKIKGIGMIYPANPGVFLSYTLGENLSFSFDSDQYGKGYYGWSESLRSHLSLTNEIELNSSKFLGTGKIKSIVLYSEYNTSDLYIVSWATNRSALSFFEIFKLGLGARVKF